MFATEFRSRGDVYIDLWIFGKGGGGGAKNSDRGYQENCDRGSKPLSPPSPTPSYETEWKIPP